MSVLRNDKELTTADIVNADDTITSQPGSTGGEDHRDPQDFSRGNLQPQQGASVAEREHSQGATDTSRNQQFPDLQDQSDPRLPAHRNVTANGAQEEEETRGIDTSIGTSTQRREEERDSRPMASVAGSPNPALPANTATASVANAAIRATSHATAGATSQPASGPLFPEDELHNFRTQWDHVQASFVDEPRQAVQQADSLVANVVKRIAEQFAEERARLEKQWDRGDDVSTEDLRQGLRRYRAFFDRLLSF